MNTTAAQTRAMFIGTCRMHDPVNALQNTEGLMARSTPHRFHTPAQTLQFVRHMAGAPQYRPDTIHLVSDHASTELFVNGTSREQLCRRLESLATLWDTFRVFVIEICALREFVATVGRKQMTVNTFAKREQERYADQITAEAEAGISLPLLPIEMERLSEKETHRLMKQIKSTLKNRPIIWVSHQRPPDLPQYEVANNVRRALAEIVQSGANQLGDRFFDPTEVAREMGAEAFFQKDGTDIDHMTPEAAKVMAARYHKMINEAHTEARRQAAQAKKKPGLGALLKGK
ncbi:hypothetical protein N4R57_01020 [Rhodobacteraceae bacterium D3-12]|nr:hypothetical protein N4R57_01020 [Rhodobacteraceae bacterium D3-12]